MFDLGGLRVRWFRIGTGARCHRWAGWTWLGFRLLRLLPFLHFGGRCVAIFRRIFANRLGARRVLLLLLQGRLPVGFGRRVRFRFRTGEGAGHDVCEPVAEPARSGVHGRVRAVDADSFQRQPEERLLLAIGQGKGFETSEDDRMVGNDDAVFAFDGLVRDGFCEVDG